METTGEAHQIVLTPDRNIVTADGKDATVVNVTVLDNKGREVPTANHLVAFSLEGDASIIGVGNGDPSSHEPDKMDVGDYRRSLFNGKCQMILQAGNDPGKVMVNATSAGLKSATVSIQLVKTNNNLIGKR